MEDLMEEQDPKTGESPLRLILREVEELRREIREQGKRLAELEMSLSRTAGNATDIEAAAAPPAPEADAEIAPERMAVIAAVVTAFLGRNVRIHKARLVNPEVVSPWAQQGRVFVQASHALVRH
jgi:methylmalonyl-CoA carboxyltransferase large subunit